MANFNELRKKLKAIKDGRKEIENNAFLARENLKKLDRQKKNLHRTESDSERLHKIIKQERALRTQIDRYESALTDLIVDENRLLTNFEQFTDPTTQISRLSDEYPILLLPLRLETRYKKLTSNSGINHQLWVRVFPDECSIDTFEDTLTESEIRKAKDYWLSYWSTGASNSPELEELIVEKRKAAWRILAGNFQPGRAYWITEKYVPENLTDLPVRIKRSDIFLCIGVEEMPLEPDVIPLKNYWHAVWLAGKDEENHRAALNEFLSVIGDEERGLDLIEKFKPFNLENTAVLSENTPHVEVHFVRFSESAGTSSRISSWSQAAKITTLPEKLVLLGFKGEKDGRPIEVFKELGNTIPDPLIMGPNPSADIQTLLKSDFIEEYNSQGNEEQKEAKLRAYYDELSEERKSELTQEEYIDDFLRLSGDEATLALNRMFDDLRDEVKAARYVTYLSERSETKWLFDFEEAVRIGMGFKVNLSHEEYDQGFDRLLVLGAKVANDEITSKEAVEELFKHHHFGASGFSIVPQGAPTNNTEEEGSEYSEQEEHDASFERYFSSDIPEGTSLSEGKEDGQYLAQFLGIDPSNSALSLTKNFYLTDQIEAKAMNTALWNATMGYFMESLLTPVFTNEQQRTTRSFFTNFVSGRGRIPAIRIADQPYGILPTSKVTDAQWLFSEGEKNKLFLSRFGNSTAILKDLYKLTTEIYDDFKPLLADVAYVGKKGDPHQILLDVLGLHATSVEFHQRYAESFSKVFNQLNMSGLGQLISALIIAGYKKRGTDLLDDLGYQATEKDDPVPILEKFFLTSSNLLKGDMIDDLPLSEERKIRSYTDADSTNPEGMNYIEWLIENASEDFNALKRDLGLKERPKALLFQMLKHSLMIEYSNTSLNHFQNSGIIEPSALRKAKIDEDFIGIKEGEKGFESKLEFLEQTDLGITNAGVSVADHIIEQLKSGNPLGNFDAMLNSLKTLKDIPTARLERAFVEHLDSCTYRLDAWILGFVNLQLELMRKNSDSDVSEPKQGLFLGAYGWVEDLKPDKEDLKPLQLESELASVFNPEDKLQIVSDSSNAGYVHAPSVNQAITAAVLRNAYISEATPEDPEIYKVNLSSERVRMALSLIQGIQQGQSLGALLGYQLERGLHDRYQEADVDIFIYELRKHFSLSANHIAETSESEEDLDSITQVEARNVVDGYKLLKHVNETGNTTYPFGLTMQYATAPEFESHRKIVNEEVNRLRNINDAVADLAIAEGVHQVVQSNYDRAAGTMDAFSKGGFPPDPEVIQTPRSGIGLTNRIGIHLKSGLIISDPEIKRARLVGEPALNEWLEMIMPDLEDICCEVFFGLPTYNDAEISFTKEIVDANQLKISHIDLVYMINVGKNKSLDVLDEYIIRYIHENHNLRPDAEIKINYTAPVADKITFFEIMPLIKNLRTLILESRPLKPSDMMLSGEAGSDTDLNCKVRVERLESVLGKFKVGFKDATNLADGLKLLESSFLNHFDPEDFEITISSKVAIIDEIDHFISEMLQLLSTYSEFGFLQSGFGTIYQRKATIYSNIYQKILEYRDRWVGRTEEYNHLVNVEYLKPGFSDEQKMEILQRAERLISTSYLLSSPNPPSNHSSFRSKLIPKKQAFDDKLVEINSWLDSNFQSIKTLMDNVNKMKTGVDSVTGAALSQFDLILPDFEEDERQIVVFGEDLVSQFLQLNELLKKRGEKAERLLSDYVTQVDSKKKLKLVSEAMQELLGDEFKIFPEFKLIPQQGKELKKAFEAREQILDYQRDELDVDFPLDDWLYGNARVREKVSALESLMVYSEGFKDVSVGLSPIQLPFRENDIWLGLSFPDSYEIESDKLLYTAVLSDFNETKSQCGIFVDEWTEVIPSEKETTGLSFQYDQPNTEAPQSMLLVTPASFKDAWEWSEVVDALHDTLDLAKLRAIEPKHIDNTAYSQFLPATVAAVTSVPFVTIAMNYAVNNGLIFKTEEDA
ncbi:hypothetical protein E7Z59_11615 [Robertkochia marina]|uniref:Uncharacterized protein n=1 Tax=Robertkochia marina TaxID=1227945 RepID=A0A4S3M0B7_9FLAO|nr:hypothetical protein [Robertkochia marina]THD66447.1 hypothetical protein E7Z59_11615 [Robertkochia marina]TRZ44124.1 hypothetical protein D3A96_09425 [Robertkochia marina]